jgi:hypothetical protein
MDSRSRGNIREVNADAPMRRGYRLPGHGARGRNRSRRRPAASASERNQRGKPGGKGPFSTSVGKERKREGSESAKSAFSRENAKERKREGNRANRGDFALSPFRVFARKLASSPTTPSGYAH